MLNLNKVNLDLVKEDFELNIEVIGKFYPSYADKIFSDASDFDKEYLSEKISNCAGELGYIYYQREDEDQSKYYLGVQSEALSRKLFYQKPPEIVEHTRTPWEYIEALELVISFGNENDLEILTKIEDIKFIHGTPEEVEECKFLAYTAFALRAFLKSGSVESSLLTDLLALSESKNVNREEKHFIVPVVHGLKALLEKDKDAWDASVQEALDAHLKEVKSGDYRDNVDGFICMPGMMLIKLGADKGWQSTIDSLYLPKQLMELS